MIVAFLKSVLPENGLYLTAYMASSEAKHPSHKIYNHIDGVLNYCHAFSHDYRDAWFALASYKQRWHQTVSNSGKLEWHLRTQENAANVKSLWLDIDVGEGKDYPTRAAAERDLLQFCRTLRFPCPWIVGSGKGGLHVYWPFTQSVDKTEWAELAARLHAATLALGLKADSSRTQDCASILRAPGTWNMKGVADGGTPHQVQILVKGTEMPFAYFTQQLAAYEPIYVKTQSNKIIQQLLNTFPDISAYTKLSAQQADELNKKYFTLDEPELRSPLEIARGCAQIRCMDSAKEPAWYAALSVLRFCKEGFRAAEILSPSEKWRTQYHIADKWAQLENLDIKPASCSTFESKRPELCLSCPHKGVIKSPIGMPRETKTICIYPEPTQVVREIQPQPENVEPAPPAPPTPVSVPTESTDGETYASEYIGQTNYGLPAITRPKMSITTEIVEIPRIETKSTRVNENGCYIRKMNPETQEYYWHRIWDEPIYPIMRYQVRDNKGTTDVVFVLRRHTLNPETNIPDGYQDIEVRGEALASAQSLATTLASRGVLFNSSERTHMSNAIIDLIRVSERQKQLRGVDASNQLGWSKDRKTFLLGGKLYFATGEVLEYTPFGKAANASEYTTPVGDLSSWKQAANVYNQKGMEWAQAIMAAAFASPIMCMGNATEKAATLFVMGDASAGKTTAAELAVSVYGDPTELRSSKDDTYLSRIEKLGVWKNIAVSFDEMTNMSPREYSDLAYQITQGRGRDRMASDGTRLVTNDTRWSCLPVMTANTSVYGALAQHSNDPTPQMIRILELRATNHFSYSNKEEMVANSRLLAKRETNFGVAGDIFMRYVVANQDIVVQAIERFTEIFRAKTQLTNEYRFWVSMSARMITGLWLAKSLQLVDYDVDAFIDYLAAQVLTAKKTVQSFSWQPEQAFEQFLAEHIGNRVVVTSSNRPQGMNDNPAIGADNDIGYVIAWPAHGREIVTRYELDTEMLYINQTALKHWCNNQRYPYAEVRQAMEAKYEVISGKGYRTDLGRGTQYRQAGRVTAIRVKYPKELINATQ